jgi:dihydrofolate reductase
MAKLIYTAITSLDGYVSDASGKFDWAEPSEEVHAFVNDLERDIGTYLYGRRLYETMVAWEHPEEFAGDSAVMQDYAQIWKSAEKIVYSHTLGRVSSARTRIERTWNAESVRQLKESASRDLSIGGPHLAAEGMRAGLVDELRLFVTPIVVGGGNAALPQNVRATLDLVDQRGFASGAIHLHYRVRSS